MSETTHAHSLPHRQLKLEVINARKRLLITAVIIGVACAFFLLHLSDPVEFKKAMIEFFVSVVLFYFGAFGLMQARYEFAWSIVLSVCIKWSGLTIVKFCAIWTDSAWVMKLQAFLTDTSLLQMVMLSFVTITLFSMPFMLLFGRRHLLRSERSLAAAMKRTRRNLFPTP